LVWAPAERLFPKERRCSMPVWAWILIIVLLVLVLGGGFGYSRR
jgi:hypothetical protein